MALTDTLGGVAVDVLYDSPTYTADSLTSVRPIPGVVGAATGNSFVDLGGRVPLTFSYGLRVGSYADFLSLVALVGTSTSLVYADGTFTVVLKSLERKKRTVDGSQICDAEFVVIG